MYDSSNGSTTSTQRYFEIGIAVLIAGLWLLVQGFEFGVGNNIFHIPFVLRWNELSTFANDPFYQTLPNFTSGLWWLLRFFVTEESIKEVFLILHVLGRLGTVAALLYMLRALTSSLALRLTALLVVVSSPLMRNASPIGGHGMLIDYLTQTEFAWPFFLGAFCFAHRGKWHWSAAFAGITFAINAFVGIWCVTVLAIAAYFGSSKPLPRVQFTAALTFIVVAAPVAAWVFQASVLQARSAEFSFIDYVRAYYPSHFLIEAAVPHAIAKVGALALCALYACRVLGSQFWTAVILALGGLILIGIVTPYSFDSRFLFNLHLLRADGALIFVAVPLAAAAAMQLLTLHEPERDGSIIAITLILGCFSGQFIPALALLIVLHSTRSTRRRLAISILAAIALAVVFALSGTWGTEERALAAIMPFAVAALMLAREDARPATFTTSVSAIVLFAALVAVGVALDKASLGGAIESTIAMALLLVHQHSSWFLPFAERWKPAWFRANLAIALTIAAVCLLALMQLASAWSERPDASRLTTRERDWLEMSRWTRESSLRGPILVPLRPEGVNIDHNFQLHSRKSVWVDWKQGAAVMWAPSFHEIWRPRFEAVRKLRTALDHVHYARENEIELVLIQRGSEEECPPAMTAIHANASFLLCRFD